MICVQNLLYQKDKLDSTSYHEAKGDLPMEVRKAIMPIYTNLCKREMLGKCLHGKTQNANESFNGMIWDRVPKSTHVGLDILSVGVYDAVAHFNYGKKAAIDIIELLKIDPGVHMTNSCRTVNTRRKLSSIYRMSEKLKKRRKILRHSKKKTQDKNIDIEGPTYEPGGF